MAPLGTVRIFFEKSCKTCQYLHLKLWWKCEDPNGDRPIFYCDIDLTDRPHWGIKDLPEELYCDRWESHPNYYCGN